MTKRFDITEPISVDEAIRLTNISNERYNQLINNVNEAIKDACKKGFTSINIRFVIADRIEATKISDVFLNKGFRIEHYYGAENPHLYKISWK